jgi:hypothetical protein
MKLTFSQEQPLTPALSSLPKAEHIHVLSPRTPKGRGSYCGHCQRQPALSPALWAIHAPINAEMYGIACADRMKIHNLPSV